MRLTTRDQAGDRRWRLNRRRTLLSTMFTGAGLTALSLSCSSRQRAKSTQSGSNSQATERPRTGGVLNYAGGKGGSYDTQGFGFDPDVQLQFFAKGYTLFYERLVAYKLGSYEVEAELAEKWEQPSPTEYLFHLRPGVKWQDKPPVNARPLTVDDVTWSLERARTDDPKFYTRSLMNFVDKIEAPDKATVRITTKSPDAVSLKKLASDNLAVLAKEVLDKYPKPTTADAVVGTGPFMMKSVEDKVAAEYVRNPGYWKPGLPYLDGFRTRYFSDPLAAWAAFLATQVDVALVPGAESKQYIARQGSGFTPQWNANDDAKALYPNIRQKVLSDARVVRALRLMVDHDEFIKAWAELQSGRGTYASALPPALSAWDLTQQEYGSHLEWKQPKDDAAKEAVTLLSAAGFNAQNPLRFTLDCSATATMTSAAQLIQSQWKRFSQGAVDMQIKPSDSPTLNAIESKGTFTYGFFGHTVGMADPDVWLTSSFHSGGSLNFTGFSDPALDAMIDKQRGLFDETQRKAAVKEIILYLIDHGPSTIPAGDFALDAVQAKVRGHVPENYLNGHQYQSVWLAA